MVKDVTNSPKDVHDFWYNSEDIMPKQTNNNDLENAYINYHSPWISQEEREHWKKEIKRLSNK